MEQKPTNSGDEQEAVGAYVARFPEAMSIVLSDVRVRSIE
jgi:hypothetical protein